MATQEQINIIIKAMADNAIKEIDKVNKGLGDLNNSGTTASKKLSDGFKNIKLYAAIAAAAVVAFYVDAARAAIDAVETNQKFSVVFKDVIDEANRMAEALAEGYGLARDEARMLLGNTGDLLTGFGMSGAAALEMSNRVQQLAADLASFTNYSGGARGASEALTSALLGERERVKQLGIVIRETDVQQELATMGMRNATGQARLQATAQATLNIALRQSQNAIGDFARSADSPANVLRSVSARMRDIKVEIGTNMLPGLQSLGNAFLNATRDGGILINAAKAIGTAFARLGQAIAWLINAMETISRDNQMAESLRESQRQAGNASTAMSQLTMALNQTRDAGITSTTSYRQATEQLRNLASQGGATGQRAQELLSHMQGLRAQIDSSSMAASRSARTATAQSQAYARSRQEMLNLENAIRGVTNTTEHEIQARNRSTQATAGQEGANERQAAALRKAQEEAKKFIENLQSQADPYERLNLQRENSLAKLQEYYAQHLITTEQNEQARMQIVQQYENAVMQLRMKNIGDYINGISGMVNQVGSIFSQFYRNKGIQLNNDYKKEKAAIEASITNEEDKKAALEALDEKYEKERRRLARDQAKFEKTNAIIQSVINTAQGVTKALAQGGFFGGPAMATVIGALGAAQVALIARQPIPEAADGGLIPGSQAGTLIRAGEGGRSEAIIPLENTDVMQRIGGGGTYNVTVNFDNMWAGSDMPREVADAIDKALYQLAQDKNSRFAASL